MSGKPYSQKSGLKNHTNKQIFQVMTHSNITTHNIIQLLTDVEVDMECY